MQEDHCRIANGSYPFPGPTAELSFCRGVAQDRTIASQPVQGVAKGSDCNTAQARYEEPLQRNRGGLLHMHCARRLLFRLVYYIGSFSFSFLSLISFYSHLAVQRRINGRRARD